jgi:GT2 family glycosyltransferase
MLFSVVVPTCNRNDLLSECLNLLAPSSQSIPGNCYEVIVTDDSKGDVAKNVIEQQYPWAKWVVGPKRGPAANRNNGANKAVGEWLVFIDDDCLPDVRLLEEYKKGIQTKPTVVAYEGRIFVDTPATSLIQESPINNSGGYFWSCNICIKKELFSQLKGFDENYPFAAMEDVDFFLRLRKITDRHKFLYDAAVLHPWRTNRKLFSTILKRYKSQLYYISKHPEGREKMNAAFYFRSFFIFFSYTLKNAARLHFSGFFTKLCCDFLQLYFGLRALLRLDKEYRTTN